MRMSNGRPTVLVMHGEDDLREMIASILDESGFAVAAAGDAAAGLALLAATPVELAVVAARLPQACDGVETIARARRHHPPLRALLIAEAADRHRFGDDDRDAVITRPFDARQLLGCAYELLLREDDHHARLRHRYAAEAGIALARLACLGNRRITAEGARAYTLLQELAAEIDRTLGTHGTPHPANRPAAPALALAATRTEPA